MSTDNATFKALIGPVARLLLGDPNKALSSKHELRFGSRGSLSIDLDKATWHDHETNQGGGFLDLITREKGLEGKDRFVWLAENGFEVERRAPSSKNGSGLGHIIATYDYTDEDGKTIFQVVRFDPKDFRQRRPDAGKPDGWSWSVRGLRWVPYRLPDLLEDIAYERPVFLVEGEKAVDALRKAGIPATCNPGGAGKWRSELSDYFADADVVIIEDNDPQKTHPKTGEPMFHQDGRPMRAGQDHAQDVASHLNRIAKRVRVLSLAAKAWPDMPPKAGADDWLLQGKGSPEKLYALTEELPDWQEGVVPPAAPVVLVTLDLSSWQDRAAPERRWPVPGCVPARNVGLLSGEGGVGKTLIIQQLSIATVLGRDWLGKMPEPGPVIFITAEDDEDELHFRYEKIVKHYDAQFRDLRDLHLMSLAGRDAVMAVTDAKGIVRPTELFQRLANTAREVRPKWIGLDTAADIFIVDERNRSEVRQCIGLLRGLALEIDASIILLSHPSLVGIASGSGLSGSTAWNNSVRSRLYLKTEKKAKDDDVDEEDDEQTAVRVLEVMKSNYGPVGERIRLTWKNGLLVNAPGSIAPAATVIAASATEIFLKLLARYERNGVNVSEKPTANNFAPALFAKEPEAKALDTSTERRKSRLLQAMRKLFSKERIYVGETEHAHPSKRKACLRMRAELHLV